MGLAGNDARLQTGAAYKLVLMRHGESTANLDGSYAGWMDVPLTATGIGQARSAGLMLRGACLDFDVCYTSVLKRATQTAWHCLDAMERTWLPVVHSWRLNERHYGALQGLSKAETESSFGKEQVRLWRRGYETRPPALAPADRRKIQDDPRYATLCPREIPLSESMRDAVLRVLPLWQDAIAPCVANGKRVLIVAHGTTIRAFAGLLGGLSEAEVERVEVPNGIPLVYELDAQLRPDSAYYCSEPRVQLAAATGCRYP